MNLIAALRRRFMLYDNEEKAIDFLAGIIGVQLVALFSEGVNHRQVLTLIANSKTLRGYFIGLAFHADDAYKFGDFTYVLASIGHVLNRFWGTTRPPEANLVAVLVDSFNKDRKEMDAEFTKGLEMATNDAKFYHAEGRADF